MRVFVERKKKGRERERKREREAGYFSVVVQLTAISLHHGNVNQWPLFPHHQQQITQRLLCPRTHLHRGTEGDRKGEKRDRKGGMAA